MHVQATSTVPDNGKFRNGLKKADAANAVGLPR